MLVPSALVLCVLVAPVDEPPRQHPPAPVPAPDVSPGPKPAPIVTVDASSLPSCGTAEAIAWRAEHLDRLRRSTADVSPRRPRSVVPPAAPRREAPGVVTGADLFAYEDTNALLQQPFDFGVAVPFMIEAANALVAAHGDSFDFVGFLTNYDPGQILSVFYSPISNDVQGIGQSLFDDSVALGVDGAAIQGLIMMWDINSTTLQPGAGPDAFITRMFLAHEFEHRYAVFLPPLVGGQKMQGEFFTCGREFHWHRNLDGQGSAMEMSDWVGVGPATLFQSSMGFNNDIVGGAWSYLDLYLMGYVSGAEMDAGVSELRYMDTSDCSSPYFGTITPFGSAQIQSVAGARVPSSATSPKDFRAGWVMFHLPGDPPDQPERDKAAAILNQLTLDWSVGTLGRGTLDNTLPARSGFADLRNGLDGTQGVPLLAGVGNLAGGSTVDLELTDGLPSGAASLVLGFSSVNAPFKLGVFVPSPDVILPNLPLAPDGSLAFGFTWPTGIPAGFQTFWQYWLMDPAGPVGWSASNAIVGTTP